MRGFSYKMSFLLIQQCDKLKIWRHDGSKIEVPQIHTSAWKAQDGAIAQFLINYLDTENVATVDFGNNEYNLCYNDGRERIKVFGKCEIKIDAFSAVMLEKL